MADTLRALAIVAVWQTGWQIDSDIEGKGAGPWFNIKMSSYQYTKSHCGDKTVVKSSFFHSGISYTGKMTSLYWFDPQVSIAILSLICWMLPRTNKHVYILLFISEHWFVTSTGILSHEKQGLLILYYGCWCHDDARSQSIRRFKMDLILWELYNFSPSRVKDNQSECHYDLCFIIWIW